MVRRNHYPKAGYYHHHDKGYYSFITHNTELSITNFKQALNIALKQGWQLEAVKSKIWLANHQLFQNKMEEAKSLYNQVLQESIEIDYVDGIANGYYGLSSLEADQEKILQLLIKVDSLYRERKLISPVLANSYGMIARIYRESYNDRETADKYFARSMEVARQTNYIPGIDYIGKLLGETALEEGNYEEAYSYFSE
ncbi:MAG: hypothetical protein ACR2MX_09830, partial [Cyclobacteriaceae bacterium]